MTPIASSRPVLSDTQPSGPQLVMRTENGLPERGLVGVKSGASAMIARKARIMGATKVKVSGEEVSLTGPNVEHVSQTAANIEQATTIRGFDPRVFQDGIYITSKGA